MLLIYQSSSSQPREHQTNSNHNHNIITMMSTPLPPQDHKLVGYRQPRLATRTEIVNFPAKLRDSGWKVQGITVGSKEILLSDATSMELVWFPHDSIPNADRKSAAATNSRKEKAGTRAEDLIRAREAQLGLTSIPIRSAASNIRVVPIINNFASGPALSTRSRATPAPANAAPRVIPIWDEMDNYRMWQAEGIRAEHEENYLIRWAADQKTGRPAADFYVRKRQANIRLVQEWEYKKAGFLKALGTAPPGGPSRYPDPTAPTLSGPYYGPFADSAATAPAADDDVYMDDVDYDSSQDAAGSVVSDSDPTWWGIR